MNFLGTLHATPDDRFTVKFINNNLDTRLPIRLSLNQYYQNPFQQGARWPASPGCGSVPLFNNGFNGATETPITAMQAGLGREDRRTIVGGRWEHDFDNTTTWRNQFVFDDRNISQPTGATSAIGDFPSYNYMSDVTKRGEIFGMESTTYFGAFYNTLTASSDTRNVMPGGNATLGLLQSNTFSDTSNYGVRAREELKLAPNLTAVAGIGWETTHLKGINTAYTYNDAECPDGDDRTADNRRPAIPEHRARTGAALQAESRMAVPRARRHGIRHAAGRQPLRPFEWSERQQYAAQDAAEPRLRHRVRLDAEQHAQIQRDRLLRILPQRAGDAGHARSARPMQAYTFNAPKSEHRGVELAADWKFYPGWRFTAAYTYLDEFYTEYTENLVNGGDVQLQPRG